MSSAVLEVRNLTKCYGSLTAVDNVNLTVGEGEFVAIMGPSGSGKSTLLNLIGSLDRPTAGEILLRGNPVDQIKNLDEYRNREIGFIFQSHNLIPTLTALENVDIPLHELKIDRTERNSKALQALESVGLGSRAGHRPSQLSGGERQRVAIARALVNDPKVILADEPTGELDSATGEGIVSLLKRIGRQGGKTIVMVTHNLEIAKKADRIVHLRDGRIEREESVKSELLEDLMAFASSSLGRRLAGGEPVRDPELERLGIFEDGRLGERGNTLRALISELRRQQKAR